MRADEAISELISNPQLAHRAIFEHDSEDAPFHGAMIDLLWSGSERGAVLCFRGSAKSTRSEECIALRAAFGLCKYVLVVCSTVDRAIDRLGAIKRRLEQNENLIELTGDLHGQVWRETRIELSNGCCIDAIGSGQAIRGLKHGDDRPDFLFCDDIEEMSAFADNCSTPERRRALSSWFYSVLLPCMSRDGPKIRMCGTRLHPESLIARVAEDPLWESMVVPIEHFDERGGLVPSWPSRYPAEWISMTRDELSRAGRSESFEMEYMCRASAPESHAFREEYLSFEDRQHTWEPCHAAYDPARTAVVGKSCATGKVVASWVGNKLLVWEAEQLFLQPSDIIDDIFKTNEAYSPISIAFEETGLNQWAMQPLRQAQITRGSIPLRPVNPPRGPGKENFLLRLEPFFRAGEVVFMGPRRKFEALIKELLEFPYGLKDTLNALAYLLEIKPGEPIFDRFGSCHVVEAARLPQWAPKTLLLHSDGLGTVGILVATHKEITTIIADWHEAAAPVHVVSSIARQARITGGSVSLSAIAPVEHFRPFDAIGLVPAARSASLTITQGGGIIQGREELHEMMMMSIGQEPTFQVSRAASWTLRALNGGYATEPGKTVPSAGPYRLIGEALESFAATMVKMGGDAEPNAFTKDNMPYFSSMPHWVMRRRNRG